MRTRLFLGSIIVTLLFILTACALSPTPTVSPTATIAATPTATPEPEKGLNFLVSSSGSVQLKRRVWSAYQPVAFGTTIRRGDLIRPSSGAEVTILCSDLTVHIIDQEDGSPCRVREPDLFWEGVRIVNPMAAPADFPYILHPRKTQIVDARPWLRWHDNGGSSYTVAIIQGGEAIWQQSGVTGTELRYPNDAPLLEAGVNYLLEVINEDSGASSNQEPIKGLGFQLLPAETASLVEQTQAEIRALPLDAGAQSFALAIYYAGQGLNGEALALLDEVAQTHNSPLVQLWRGHMFLATRLNEEAQEAYTEAMSLATTLGDIETQAQAQTGLWRATNDESYFDAAILLYQQLGDEQTITDLQEEK
ncbi:hypothetical protein MNBD_CHLOROFLEXI01-2235 [hydrothermal vent metagenome]|uniref:Tetratricopeptide repeat protein n=1 Tax=hydrothermal vent metagenome TaxID=652676 RepID=A0A3B0UH17_9ZZZZ